MSAPHDVVHGDCLDVLRAMDADSVDAVVCDPPAGISFMGKAWDGDKGGRDAWIAWLASVLGECRRVLKPGGHALVWALPRTSHWTGMALEDAGFEVRDRIAHLFGSGFPKSLDVSKAIDKAAGEAREVIGPNPFHHGGGTNHVYAQDEWTRENFAKKTVLTAPATDAARQWAGWGTALKPAVEDWWLARKPLAGTVARTVERYGTGALNIDATRVATDDRISTTQGRNALGIMNDDGWQAKPGTYEMPAAGRWPANVALSHSPDCNGACAPGCPVAALDAQSGERTSGRLKAGTVAAPEGVDIYGARRAYAKPKDYGGDTGGASRFFLTVRPDADAGDLTRFRYVAKASRAEREAGLAGFDVQRAGVGDERPGGSMHERAGDGRPVLARNHHPTVKPLALMRWLVRLVTPPGGLVLDPFCGSGSTGAACALEGVRFLGIEQDADYVAISRARIAHWAAVAGETQPTLEGIA